MSKDAGSGLRPAANGDVSSDLSQKGIEQYVVNEAIENAVDERLLAVQDVLTNAKSTDRIAVAEWLNAMIEGSSSDDLPELRRVLLEQDEPIYGTPPMHDPDVFVEHWQRGTYP